MINIMEQRTIHKIAHEAKGRGAIFNDTTASLYQQVLKAFLW